MVALAVDLSQRCPEPSANAPTEVVAAKTLVVELTVGSENGPRTRGQMCSETPELASRWKAAGLVMRLKHDSEGAVRENFHYRQQNP